jgi:hypothetical protein
MTWKSSRTPQNRDIACGNDRASGLWTDAERLKHISYLELLAAFFGLKSLL